MAIDRAKDSRHCLCTYMSRSKTHEVVIEMWNVTGVRDWHFLWVQILVLRWKRPRGHRNNEVNACRGHCLRFCSWMAGKVFSTSCLQRPMWESTSRRNQFCRDVGTGNRWRSSAFLPICLVWQVVNSLCPRSNICNTLVLGTFLGCSHYPATSESSWTYIKVWARNVVIFTKEILRFWQLIVGRIVTNHNDCCVNCILKATQATRNLSYIRLNWVVSFILLSYAYVPRSFYYPVNYSQHPKGIFT